MPDIKKIVISYLWRIALVMVIAVLINAVLIQRIHEQRIARDSAADMFYQIGQLLEQNQAELAEVEEEYRQTCLNNAETIAYMIQYHPEILGDVEEFRRIAEFVEVDEIHIFDETGRIFTGTHPEYYGYTFDSGEQMNFFKPMLEDKTLRLVQDIMPNTAEAKPMQYSALWASNGEFIVEVGMEPVNVVKVTEKNELSYIFSLLKANPGVDLYAVDAESGEILGSTAVEDAGKTLSDIGLALADMGKYEEGAHATVSGVDSYCVFTAADDMLIGYVVSNDVLYQSIVAYTAEITITMAVIVIIFVFSVMWCTDRFVITGIHGINEKLRSIAAGNLDERVDVQINLEFSELSSHINEMIKSLLASTEKISYVLDRTNMHIGVYEYSDRMKTVRFTEHVPTILALDGGTAKRLSGDYRLFREYIDALRQDPVPGEEQVFHLAGDRDSYVKLEEVTDGSYTLGIVLDVTEEIMIRRQIEAERDRDLLTGLFNRRGLENQLTSLFKAPDALGFGALIVIDADGLKGINDQHGHTTGDAYLKKIAETIQSFGPHSSISARVGGDEFVLFLYAYESEGELLDTIDKLKFLRNNSMAQLSDGLTVPLNFSIGYSLTEGAFDYQSILRQADERMYSKKGSRFAAGGGPTGLRACLRSPRVWIVRQIFRQTRRFDTGILCVFQGKSTQYGGKDGVQAVRAGDFKQALRACRQPD